MYVSESAAKKAGTTKKRVKVKRGSSYVLSDIFDAPEQYRVVPIPLTLDYLIKKYCKDKTADGPMLTAKGKVRFKPDELLSELNALFKADGSNSITIHTGSGDKKMSLDFCSKYFRTSIEHLWAQFSLQDSEIRYLLGNIQVETAAKHYIDFNNPHKQNSMCLQMSYAMNNATAYTGSAGSANTSDDCDLFLVKGKMNTTIPGQFDKIRHTRLQILQPTRIEISNLHGMTVQKR